MSFQGNSCKRAFFDELVMEKRELSEGAGVLAALGGYDNEALLSKRSMDDERHLLAVRDLARAARSLGVRGLDLSQERGETAALSKRDALSASAGLTCDGGACQKLLARDVHDLLSQRAVKLGLM